MKERNPKLSYVSNEILPKYTLKHQYRDKIKQDRAKQKILSLTYQTKTSKIHFETPTKHKKDPSSYISNDKLPKYTVKQQKS